MLFRSSTMPRVLTGVIVAGGWLAVCLRLLVPGISRGVVSVSIVSEAKVDGKVTGKSFGFFSCYSLSILPWKRLICNHHCRLALYVGLCWVSRVGMQALSFFAPDKYFNR